MSKKIDNVKEFEEFLQQIEDQEIVQRSVDWEEDLSKDQWETFERSTNKFVDSFSKTRTVKIVCDESKWYNHGLFVFGFKDNYYACCCIVDVNCEDYYESLPASLSFVKVKQVPSVTYEMI